MKHPQTYLEKDLERIEIEKFALTSQTVFKTDEKKDLQIKNCLIEKIKSFQNLQSDKLYLLPTKEDFAYKLGVSVGTVQSAIRQLENDGYVISKQKIGTMINTNNSMTSSIQKSFTKKDMAYNAICKYLKKQNINSVLPSTRLLANQLGFSQNTIRLALDVFVDEGVIEIKKTSNSNFQWIYKKMPQKIANSFNNLSLIEKISKELINFMRQNSKIGDKLPAHNVLSKQFAVSIKTINDVIQNLSSKGFLETRRGRYGTIVVNNSIDTPQNEVKLESSIFAHASVAFEYNYQKVKNSMVDYIIKNYEVGSKLPTMKEFSQIFDVSVNTVRKALSDLQEEGCVIFQRGRFGGTFLVNLPEVSHQNAFKWIAVASEYQEVYSN